MSADVTRGSPKGVAPPMKDAPLSSRPLLRRAALMLPNALTLCAILCGLTSIRLSGEGQFPLAAVAIFAAVALDTADGLAARLLSAASAIGAELNSLADFVNFGVAGVAALLERFEPARRGGLACGSGVCPCRRLAAGALQRPLENKPWGRTELV